MYSIKINDKNTVKTNLNINSGKFEGAVNAALVNGDFIKVNSNQYHFLYKGKSYNVDVLKINPEEKTLSIKINSHKFNLQLKDKYDELLHSLGMDQTAVKKINDIKAPMPGMVLKVMVKEGDAVKKGDALLVLEAMKMENILKSPSEGIIKKIVALKGTAVEKNQLLIQF